MTGPYPSQTLFKEISGGWGLKGDDDDDDAASLKGDHGSSMRYPSFFKEDGLLVLILYGKKRGPITNR